MFRSAPLTIVVMGAAALWAAPQAGAQPDLTDRAWAYADEHGPAICRLVDANPTVRGFGDALDNLGGEGFSVYEASGILIAALSASCPGNYWLVDAFAGPETSSTPTLI